MGKPLLFKELEQEVKKALYYVFGKVITVEIIDSLDIKAKCLSVDRTWDVLLGEDEIDTVAGKKKVDCWELYKVCIEHNYPNEPDWSDPVFVEKFQKTDDLIRAIIMHMAIEMISIHLENEGMYQAWRESREA